MSVMLQRVAALWRWWLALAAVLACSALAGFLDSAARTHAVPAVDNGAHPLDPLIRSAAHEHLPRGWDWRILKALVRQESGYDPQARSPGGALGLCQLMPATARALGLDPARADDPRANLAAGARYLADLHDRWRTVSDGPPQWSATRLAIAAYNAGPGRVERAVQAAGSTRWDDVMPHLPASTGRHVQRIMDQHYPAYASAIHDRPRGLGRGWRARPEGLGLGHLRQRLSWAGLGRVE